MSSTAERIRAELVEVGTRVAYEDMANPRREGRVTAILRDGREFEVAWDGETETVTSDLRQPGWRIVADMPGSIFDGADVIHVVTRFDLIESGDLVPVPDLVPDEPDFALSAGFMAPVCLTRAVAAIVVPNEKEQRACQDVKGRLWDLLSMARMYRGGRKCEEWRFPCLFVLKRDGRGATKKVVFRIVVSADENGDAATTILLDGES